MKKVWDKFDGQVITVLCCRYIYTGKLTGYDDVFIELSDPKIVLETGPLGEKDWKRVLTLPENPFYLCIGAIESVGVIK